jgi:hypothetical protein
MAVKKGINGIAKKGLTRGKNLGDDGPKVGLQGGATGAPKGVSDAAKKKIGKGLAKRNYEVGRGK